MYSAGSTIGGKYALVQQIGEGGMATVWRAVHTMLDREVAVKFIETRGPNADKVAARFLDEARIAAAVRHRNVVDIIDFGTTPEGQPYMVMELLQGESLADRFARAPALTLPETVTTISLALSGLGAVHDKGIVHRDLKPENVFLVEDADGSFPKLLDFGISKSVEGQVKAGRVAALTQEGTLLGTPHYMSPEQARGLKDVDKRTDLYSMGVILYEALCGRLPFDSENLGDLLMMVIQDDYQPVAVLRPEVGTYISAVVDRALAKNRDERFSDAREMRTALLEAAGVPREVSGLTQLMTGGSGLIRPELLTPSAGLAVATPEQARPVTGQHAPLPRPVTGQRAPVPRPVDVETADTLPPPERGDPSVPVPLVAAERAGATPLGTPRENARGSATPARTALARTPNAWDSVPPTPAARSKLPWVLAGLALLLGGAAVAELRPQWLGLAGAPLGLFGQPVTAGRPIPVAPDAGADAGPPDAGVPMIAVRLLGVPTDATVVLDDATFVAESLAATRTDGAVVLAVPRHRGPFEVTVTAPGRERWRARRWALRDWEWTVELELLDAGPPDAGATGAGAEPSTGEPTTPAVGRPRRPPTKIRRPHPRNRRRAR